MEEADNDGWEEVEKTDEKVQEFYDVCKNYKKWFVQAS